MNENLNNSSEEIIQDVTNDVEEIPRLREQPLHYNNESNNNTQNQNLKEIKKSKKKILPIVLSIIILVLIGILIFVTLYIRDSKVILSQNISKLYNSLLENKEENSTLKAILNNDKVSIESNMEINLDDESGSFDGFDNLEFNYSYIEDKQAKKGYLDFESFITDEEFINLDSLLQDNKLYINLKDITENYYFLDYEFVSLLSNKNNNDIKEILDIFKNNIIKNINDDNLTTENVTIKVDNKDTKTRKISFVITDKLINTIVGDSFVEIQNSESAKESLKNFLDVDDSEIDELISNTLRQIDESNEYTMPTSQIIYNMYIKGLNKTVKQEIIIEDSTFEFYEYDETKEFNILSNSQNILGLKIIGSNNEGQITGIFSGLSITGSYKTGNIELTLAPEGTANSGNEINLNIITDSKEISKNEEYQNTLNLNFEVLTNNSKVFDFSLNTISNIKVGDEVPDIDVEGARNINTITEEEQAEIMNKILEIPVIKNLIESSNQTNNYYYNEGYDYTFEEEYKY